MHPQPTSEPMQIGKPKPPVAVQVLYGLGFAGLIFGLYYSILIYTASRSSTLVISTKLYGVSISSLQTLAIVYAALAVGSFTLINFIRSGKKWALISYSVLLALNAATNLTEVSARKILIYQLLVLGILVILWTKDRSYFN